MDFIKKIILISFIVLTTFCINCANCEENAVNSSCSELISAHVVLENDFINSKDNEFSLSAVNNSETIVSKRKNKDNQFGNNPYNFVLIKNNENLISYLYLKDYLESNSELALQLLLFQMQPNAP